MFEQITISTLKIIVGSSDPTQRGWGWRPSDPHSERLGARDRT